MNKFVQTAIKFIGVTENDSEFKTIIDTYNTIKPLPRNYKLKYNDSWCMGFVSAIAKMCNISDFPFECSCEKATAKARKNNQISTVPKIGYLIMYDWNNDGSINHVGIITEINDNTLTVIEGNKNEKVAYRTINVNNANIECYIIVNVSRETIEISNDKITQIAYDVIKGKYGNGSRRKVKLGSMYKIVQKRVNEILANSRNV